MTFELYDALAGGLGTDIFAGGLALGLFGLLAGLAGAALRLGWRGLRARLSVTVTLDNRTPAYGHFLLWVERTGALDHARRRQVAWRREGAGGQAWLPAEGRHWFRHVRRLCVLDRSVGRPRGGGAPLEVLTVTLIGGGFAVLRGWIDAGAAMAEAEARRGPVLHVWRRDYWDRIGEVSRRGLDSVLAEDDRLGRLLDDVRWFYGAEDWFAERGVPWRRGYLLYGPPGTGKSSAVRAVASELGLDLALIGIGQPGLGDDGLAEAMSAAPARSILLIEDIDAAFTARAAGEAANTVTFSGLLNAIDGVVAQEGRALFMTTNHRDRLDPALIRPGRADRHVELGLVGAETASRLFARFFPGEPALAARFRDRLGAAEVSPAEVQGWLMTHLDDPGAAAEATGLAAAPALAAE